jgi:hypothetical protein
MQYFSSMITSWIGIADLAQGEQSNMHPFVHSTSHRSSNMAVELVPSPRLGSGETTANHGASCVCCEELKKIDGKLDALIAAVIGRGMQPTRRQPYRSRAEVQHEIIDRPWNRVSLDDAVERGEFVGGVVNCWRSDRGFGFM